MENSITNNYKISERMKIEMDRNSSLVEQATLNLIKDMNKQIEDKCKEKFFKITGEELTEKNANRIVIEIHEDTKEEWYKIDGELMFILYPLQTKTIQEHIAEPWKLKVWRNIAE